MFWCICMFMHAYISVCTHACMGVWTFRSMYMCFHMYIYVCAHACVYVHFCNTPPQVLKLASLALPPPPPPTPILKIFLRIWAKQQFLGHRLKHKIILISFLKVRKDAKIRNRYTQVPHLTQHTPSGSDKTQWNITYKRAKRSVLSQQETTRLQ